MATTAINSQSRNYRYSIPNVALNYDQSRVICYCFGARTWTKIIAIVQILYALTVSSVRLTMIALQTSNNNNYNETNDNETEFASELMADHSEWYYEPVPFICAYVNIPIPFQLVEGLTGIICGLILLTGALLGKPCYLKLWLILRLVEAIIILVVFYVFVSAGVFGGLFHAYGLSFVLVVLFPFFLLTVQVFSFSIVFIHYKELVYMRNERLKDATNYVNLLVQTDIDSHIIK